MRSMVAGILGIALMANGLAMLASPAMWYDAIPGVTATGPFNPHFIRDIGAAKTRAPMPAFRRPFLLRRHIDMTTVLLICRERCGYQRISMSDIVQTTERTARRVRHETKSRLLQVREVSRITPKMVRIVVGGEALAGFISAAHDDHVKLFFPHPGEEKPVLPTPSPNGPVYPEGAVRPPGRDYTPRRYDAAANTLAIDFVIHGDGPATAWAAQARPGHFLGVGGPRGSFIVPDDFDWYLLAGDETALPAIGRRLEELPAGTRAIVVAEVADSAEEQRFDTRARLETHWLHRDGAAPAGGSLLQKAIAGLTLPSGDGYAWVAAEAATAKALRRHLVDERRLRKDRVKAAAYWKHGAVAVHETYDD